MTTRQPERTRRPPARPPTEAELEQLYLPAMPPFGLIAAIARGAARWRRRAPAVDCDDAAAAAAEAR